MDWTDRLIDLALEEDLGPAGDITSRALIPEGAQGQACLVAKEPMVIAGLAAFSRVFARVDGAVQVHVRAHDGDRLKRGAKVADVKGALRSLLLAERTALNIVQRSAGIATATAQAVAAVKGSKLRILDTRKTAPGMRALSKEAVAAGGGQNHRFNLSDGVLIKDNHLAAVGGSVAEALRRARAGAPWLAKIEIEVASFAQLDEALAHGADVILLDNMTQAQIARAMKRVAGRAKVEVSGGVTLERLPALAKLGVDYVSMGAITHSARAMDLSLEVELSPA